VGIHRLLHSSCCFLNTNTAILRQLIRTARTLEAEWWQVCGEACLQGQRKMSQVFGAFGLLDFTVLRPLVAWPAFLNLWTIYFSNFPNFFLAAANHRYGGPPVLSCDQNAHVCGRHGRVRRSIYKLCIILDCHFNPPPLSIVLKFNIKW